MVSEADLVFLYKTLHKIAEEVLIYHRPNQQSLIGELVCVFIDRKAGLADHYY